MIQKVWSLFMKQRVYLLWSLYFEFLAKTSRKRSDKYFRKYLKFKAKYQKLMLENFPNLVNEEVSLFPIAPVPVTFYANGRKNIVGEVPIEIRPSGIFVELYIGTLTEGAKVVSRFGLTDLKAMNIHIRLTDD